MTFEDLKKELESKFGASKLADIAKEFDVTPQVVSNWKARNQVPYKYVQLLREKITNLNRQQNNNDLIGNLRHNIGNVLDLTSTDKHEEFPNFEDIVKSLLRKISDNIQLFYGLPIILTIIVAIHVQYFVEPVYITDLRFLPISNQNSSQISQLSSVAANFGFDIKRSSKNSRLSSAEMFPDIIKSRTLAKKLLDEKFISNSYQDTLRLSTILNGGIPIAKKDSVVKINRLAKTVSSNISVTKPRGSEIQTLVVRANEPKLAVDIALLIIDFVNEIQRKFQNNSIKEKKIFINGRASDVTRSLKKAEDKLKDFRESNRAILSSPFLMLEQTRLLREVELQTELYITLKSQLELVKIEEAGRLNSVEILDHPEVPFFKSSPNKRFRVIIGFLLSLVFTVLLIYVKSRIHSSFTSIKNIIFGIIICFIL